MSLHKEDYLAALRRADALAVGWTRAHTTLAVGMGSFIVGFVLKWTGWIF